MAEKGNDAAAKLRFLEKADKKQQQKREAERKKKEVTPQQKVLKDLVEAMMPEPAERDQSLLGKVLLEVGEIGNEHELDPDCVLRVVMIYKNHFNNTFLIANTMYCVGMIAHTSVFKTPQYWSVLSKCVIAALRYHQMDKMVLGNGVYALGNLAACATELKNLIAEASGTETILGTMRLHESDNILQANCLLAVAKVCRVPRFAPDEDFNVTSKVSEQAAAIQKEALELGAYRALLRGLALHPADAVLRRCFCEASQSLAEGNSLLSAEAPAADSAAAEGERGGEEPALVPAEAGGGEELPEVEDPQSWLLATLVQRIVHMMGSDVHPVVEALGQMVLARSTHKMAGMDAHFPLLVPEPSKQTLVGELGGVQRMCEALRQFPKKRDTVLAFTIAGLAHVIRCHEDNQRLLDKHKGVELLTASMTKWSEDKRHVFLILYTLRVLLEGSDGTRNNWYLDTFRGRTLAKMVVKMYTTEAVASGVQDKIVEAQEMARTWLPERRAQDAVL